MVESLHCKGEINANMECDMWLFDRHQVELRVLGDACSWRSHQTPAKARGLRCPSQALCWRLQR